MKENSEAIKRNKSYPAKKSVFELNRRSFISTAVLGSIASQLPVSNLYAKLKDDQTILTDVQYKITHSVQEILFPKDGNGPVITEINATDYLVWVLSDKNKDPEEVEYIINGIGWVEETAEEKYETRYLDLSQDKKEELIAFISKESWGESWLSVILSFIFEALLSDPQYGGNVDQQGWNWLEHKPGHPGPITEQLYPEILRNISYTGLQSGDGEKPTRKK